MDLTSETTLVFFSLIYLMFILLAALPECLNLYIHDL